MTTTHDCEMRFCFSVLCVGARRDLEGESVTRLDNLLGEERVELHSASEVLHHSGIDVVVLDPQWIVVGDTANWSLVWWSSQQHRQGAAVWDIRIGQAA